MKQSRISKIFALLVPALVFSISGMHAQGIEKGAMLVGGSIGFSTSSSTNTIKSSGMTQDSTATGSQFQFSLAPKLGYFFGKNFVAGLTINYNIASRTAKDADGKDVTETESQLLAGPFARYYYFPSEKVGIFGEVELGVGSGSVSPSSGNTNTISQFSVGVGTGFTFFAAKDVALEAVLKYNMMNNASKFTVSGVDYDSKSTIGTLNFLIGFQFYLNRQ
jgi:hypothetical protein